MQVREQKAREIGWIMLVTERAPDNEISIRNFELQGFSRCDPEQKWGEPWLGLFDQEPLT
jgi:hypothetical protein